LVTSAYDFDTLAVQGLFSGTVWEPIHYYINDPNHPPPASSGCRSIAWS
jgi:hypothetical protein